MAIHPSNVRLADGRSASSWSPEWREESGKRHREVLACLDLPTVQQRRAFLDQVQERHGLEERVKLENAITQTWELRRKQNPEP